MVYGLGANEDEFDPKPLETALLAVCNFVLQPSLQPRPRLAQIEVLLKIL